MISTMKVTALGARFIFCANSKHKLDILQDNIVCVAIADFVF